MGNCCGCNDPERVRRMVCKSPGFYYLQGNNVYRIGPKGKTFETNEYDMSGADCIANAQKKLLIVDYRILWCRPEDGALWEIHEDEPAIIPPPPCCKCPCAVKMPSVKMPSVNLPSVKMPSVNLPSIKMPSIDLPDLDLDLPKIEHDESQWHEPSQGWGGTYYVTVYGKYAYLATNAGNLWMVNLADGRHKQLNSNSTWYVNFMGFCGKIGKLVIASSKTNQVYTLDTQTLAYDTLSSDDWSDARGGVIKGSDAYIACGDGKLYKLDCKDGSDCKELEKSGGAYSTLKAMWRVGDKTYGLFNDYVGQIDLDNGEVKKLESISTSADDCTFL
eukprot:ANDGO_00851.mRNA.1 hypothetical protein